MKKRRVPLHTRTVNDQINLFLSGKCMDTVAKTIPQLYEFINVTRHELPKLGKPDVEVLEFIQFCLSPWRNTCPEADRILHSTVIELYKIVGKDKCRNEQRRDTWINRGSLQTL